MANNIFLLLGICTLFVSPPYVGFSAQVWNQRHQGSTGDNAFGLAVDRSNNVFVAGYSGTDYALIKYSSAGVPAWTNFFNGPGNGLDQAKAVATDSDDNVIITGTSRGSDGINDFATIKYSNTGAALWTNRFRFVGNGTQATSLAVDASGSVFVTGYSAGWNTVKYSGSGVPLWTNRYLASSPYPSDLALDKNGNVIVVGYETGPTGGDNIVSVKYSGSGLPLWTNRFNGPANDNDDASGVATDSSGNVFVTGRSVAGGAGEFVTIKYSEAGLAVWTNRYKGPGSYLYDGAYDIAVDKSGNAFVTGRSEGTSGYSDYVTIKYSGAGMPMWTNRFTTTYGSTPHAMVLDSVGNVFVTGDVINPSYLTFDCLTVGYSNTGALLWSSQFAGPANGDDAGNAIRVDSNNNVYVTGWSVGSTTSADINTLKYAGVGPLPIQVQKMNNAMVLSWDNTAFRLQAAPTINGTYTNVAGATSPYTNVVTGGSRYFKLRSN